MTESISFPHLGIYLNHVGRGISIFGFEITFYGILTGLGILAGTGIVLLEARRIRQNAEDYLELVVFAVPAALVGARMYYIVFNWELYKDSPADIFHIREGGLAIYGGILGGFLAVLAVCAVKKLSLPLVLDTACPGLAAGQAIGRWGDFFNREAFGEYTDSLFAMRLPLDAVRMSDVSERMRNHIMEEDGVRYIQAHPVFFYESVWCLFLLALLLLYRRHRKFSGEVFLMYLCGYGAGRFCLEGLRTDQLLMPVTGWPVSQVVSAALVVLSVILIIYNRLDTGKNRMHWSRQKRMWRGQKGGMR